MYVTFCFPQPCRVVLLLQPNKTKKVVCLFIYDNSGQLTVCLLPTEVNGKDRIG